MLLIASFPAVQRDLYLTRVFRSEKDKPQTLQTSLVQWPDMKVMFDGSSAVTSATVEVEPTVHLLTFTTRLERLLDCGVSSPVGDEWALKWGGKMSGYGTLDKLRSQLCDKISTIELSGETIGVMKIKRRAIKSGYAKVRLDPNEDSIQLVCRHQTPQGLKAVWKAVFFRMMPVEAKARVSNEEHWAKVESYMRSIGWVDSNFASWQWTRCDKGYNLRINSNHGIGKFPKVGKKWNLGTARLNGIGFQALKVSIGNRRFRPVDLNDVLCLQLL